MIIRCLVQIFVKDFEKSVRWYQKKLGMKLISKSEKWKSATLINKTYQKLQSKGVKFLRPPFKTPWGEYKAHFVDPDGNEFSLCQGK